jgi:hypothetical protein
MFEYLRTIEYRKEVIRVDKKCCSFDVTELENGYRVEITGDDIKEKWKTIFEKCCTDEKIKNCFSACCGKK